jgi:hypothetical protein
LYIPHRGLLLLHESNENQVIRALIEDQRRLARSTNPSERASILWLAAALQRLLSRQSDHEIGNLLEIVRERFGIFDPEFAICFHAMHRLLRSEDRGIRGGK